MKTTRPIQRRSSLDKFYEDIPDNAELDRRCPDAGKNIAGRNAADKASKNIAGKVPKAYEDVIFHEPGAFLDKYYPAWRKSVHLWPPRADGEPRVI